MSNILPQHATKYLVESLNQRTTKNIKLELAEALGAPKAPKVPSTANKNSASFGGGYGRGVGEQETDTSKNFTNVLFGSKEKAVDPLVGAGLAYGIGKTATLGADILDKFGVQWLGDVALKGAGIKLPTGKGPIGDIGRALAGKALVGIPGAVSSLLRQVGDISGAGWAEAQLGNIGRSEMQLAAQGAGSPWTPFVLPGRAKGKQQGYDPNKEADEAIAAAERAEKIKKLKGAGYNIP